MTLETLTAAPIDDVTYDPDLLHADTLRALLGAEIVAPEDFDSDLPEELAALLDTGGSADQAMAAIERAVLSGTFLDDRDELDAMGIDSRQALWNDVREDVARAPVLGPVDPTIVAQNVDTFQIFEIKETGDRMQLMINGAVAADMPLGKAKAKDIDKIIVFIQGILDSLSLAFALLGIGVAKGKTWAKNLADKLKRPKSWLSTARAAFGKFTKAYTAYKRYLAGSKEETAKARKHDAAKKAMTLFADAFLGFVGVALKTAWRILKMVLTLVFGNIREVLRLLCQLAKAAIEWAGMGPAKVANAILDAILAAIAVWDDVVRWKELNP
ncbi:hypothetical protein [Aliiroseovarius subalbicans]|uniref:hypothetical protein n=1 Tax=Aliiroseovarius subalbicans TaxID=2925840 RepID=UPI001F5A6B48|nr:hypothetical protein [Aliiroseovarius subalbicans]MCI2400400.1 hypothetical protein [Aliiroseovarius subalbicans]